MNNIEFKDSVWINNKTKNKYVLLDNNVTNCTNKDDGKIMILYKRLDDIFVELGDSPTLFVRERKEFFEKFTKEG